MSEILDDLSVDNGVIHSSTQSLMLRVPPIQQFYSKRNDLFNYTEYSAKTLALTLLYRDLTESMVIPNDFIRSITEDKPFRKIDQALMTSFNGVLLVTTPVDLAKSYAQIYSLMTQKISIIYALSLYIFYSTNDFVALAVTACWLACDQTKSQFLQDETKVFDVNLQDLPNPQQW